MAKEKGIDLRTIEGTAENGRICEADVLKAVAASASASIPSTTAPYVKSEKLVATPQAKKIAKKEKISLETLTGTGNFGRITADDVLRAAGKTPVAAASTAPEKSSVQAQSAPTPCCRRE